MSVPLEANAVPLALDDARPVADRTLLRRYQVQNIDSNDILFMLERATMPAATDTGHPVLPGEWSPRFWLSSGDYKVWVWTRERCHFLLREYRG